ncbi:uncharacterized protein [Drosophila bipectinata]|uniref:uncharacterized protein n=1 Tax=Drosophila bipectinata TaxID=42026 RepID=UPI001C89D6A4|nr:uncharacterized protein LOC108131505 [Drosophila bipectinata]
MFLGNKLYKCPLNTKPMVGMCLGRALCGIMPQNVAGSRSLHHKRVRRPLPVVPDRRTFSRAETTKPPRLLVRSFQALNQINSSYMREMTSEGSDQFLSKWKWL